MSEELRTEEMTTENSQTVEDTVQVTEQSAETQAKAETMADYEEHFDDANPWNRVQEYMAEKEGRKEEDDTGV